AHPRRCVSIETQDAHISPLALHDALPIFAPLHEGAAGLFRGAAIGREVRRRQVGGLVAATCRDRGLAQAGEVEQVELPEGIAAADRKSTRLNSSHVKNSYAVFCLKKNNPP